MPRRTVEVRRAEAADVPLLLDVVAQAAADDSTGHHRTHLPTTSAHERLSEVVARADVEVHLALCEGQPVGLVVLRVGELLVLSGGAAVRIDQLYVVPSWRRRGIAHLLLSATLGAAERTGAEEVTCVVPSGGREAHRFLARLGFARLVTLRSTPVARLRAKLGGEHESGRRRAALDALVARRRRQLDRPATPPVGMPAVALVADRGRDRPSVRGGVVGGAS